MKNTNKPMENLVNVNKRVEDFYKELVLDKPQKISILHDNDSKQLYHESMANRIYGSSYLNGKLPAASMYGQVGYNIETPHLIRYIESLYGDFDKLSINILPRVSNIILSEWASLGKINYGYRSSMLPYGTFVSWCLLYSLTSKLSSTHLEMISEFIGEKIKRSINYRKWAYMSTVPLLELIEDLSDFKLRDPIYDLSSLVYWNCDTPRTETPYKVRGFKTDYIFRLD